MFLQNIFHLIKVLLFLLIISVSINSQVAIAKQKNHKKTSDKYLPIKASLVVDGNSGQVLHARNARKKIYPASLTKVMTMYLLFESLNSGKVTMDQKLYVSKYATTAKPSKIYLKAGDRISVEDAILALSVKSANDVARVVAENLAGSESKFARLMTVRARQLGMNNTVFMNASGWHDPKHVSTAVDMAKLSIAIKRDFPEYYHFFSKSSFKFNGKKIYGHNKIVATYPGAEGLKTGFHKPSGYNLITSATRDNNSLVAVITGNKNSAERDKKMVKLLNQHFKLKKSKNRQKYNA